MRQKRIYAQARDGAVLAMSPEVFKKRNFRRISLKDYRAIRKANPQTRVIVLNKDKQKRKVA